MAGNRICPRCQGLFDVANWVCPHCGAEFAAPKPVRPGLVDRLLPSYGATTKLLSAAILLAFFVQIAVAKTSIGDAFNPLVALLGAVFGPFLDDGQYWRLITCAFLHGDLLHIGFNLFAFWQLGKNVEVTFGRARLIVIFFFCVLTGSLAAWIFNPEAATVGASGGVVGLIGVMAVWGSRRGGAFGALVKRQMIQWALFILLFGLMVPNVSNAGHAGGFVGGMLIAWLVTPIGFGTERPTANRLWDGLAIGTIGVVLLCLGMAGWNYQQVTAAAEQHAEERAEAKARSAEAFTVRQSLAMLEWSYKDEVIAQRDAWGKVAETLSEEATQLESERFDRDDIAGAARETVELLRLRSRAFASAAPAANEDERGRFATLRSRVFAWIRG